MHFHAYQVHQVDDAYRLRLSQRFSTDEDGITQCLGLQAAAKVGLSAILKQIEVKLPDNTLLTVAGPVPPMPATNSLAEGVAE
jgi:hypothetical protein